jgi:hypothetical protein
MPARELYAVFFFSLAGPGFLALGIWNLRTCAWRDGVPALELLIDRAIGEEPPPRTKTDRMFSHINGWLMIVFGAFFSLCDFAVIYSLVSE